MLLGKEGSTRARGRSYWPRSRRWVGRGLSRSCIIIIRRYPQMPAGAIEPERPDSWMHLSMGHVLKIQRPCNLFLPGERWVLSRLGLSQGCWVRQPVNFPRLQDSIKDEQFVRIPKRCSAMELTPIRKADWKRLRIESLSYAACNRLCIDEKTNLLRSCWHRK